MARVLLVTGMSGAGRSTTLKALEDIGYEAFDNLPLSLVPALIAGVAADAPAIAVGADLRTRGFALENMLETLDDVVRGPPARSACCLSTVMTNVSNSAIRRRAGPTPLPATGP